MVGCVCVRREDVDPLQTFISQMMSVELSIMAEFERKKADMKEHGAPEYVIVEEEIRAKAEAHRTKLKEYSVFIERFPQLCSAASRYL